MKCDILGANIAAMENQQPKDSIKTDPPRLFDKTLSILKKDFPKPVMTSFLDQLSCIREFKTIIPQ